MIEKQVENGQMLIIINQPEKHNAINRAMWQQLFDCLLEAQARDDVKLVILRGAGGRAFCSGGDITEYEGFFEDVTDAEDAVVGIHDVSALLRALPIPTIAAISGHCVGAGVVIAAACDFRLCTKSSHFAVTAIKRGLPYPAPAAGDLIALVGLSMTRAILLRGKDLSAVTAQAIGLVDELVEDDGFDAGLARFAAEIMSQSNAAYSFVKKSIAHALQLVEENKEMQALNLKALASDGFRASTRSFLGKG
ncbi:MAG: hypothetical protein CMN55_08440 [Sneathiella sp.]|jgi:enoyl-CoA hydratase/carnithine racemase|uniref:enoyl-CoA hydratase/isomerase family protein n=1 Tax=Sneathiella sp. TaxID=1964365 RepID=UPI000C515CAE|nr:enoyl-CoA hydratase/isomerase family protein [Sneathiella sp.]MAL79125.1 hypothetical protein [Sneathiella sp.]